MQRYISKAGESSFKTGCPLGNITYWTKIKSVMKNAKTPIVMIIAFFPMAVWGVERMSAINAVIIIEEP